LDLASVVGTGPGGRITEDDIEKAKPAAGRPKVLVERLSNTWRTVPHIHLARKIDAESLERSRHRGSSATDLLLFALSRLLGRYPALCSVWSGESLQAASGIHLAFAVDTERGVVASAKPGLTAVISKLDPAARPVRVKSPAGSV
jgi:pyruvate dehydrogenase E2 component (dihydrolipoamide acetyltransferase)